MNRVFDIKISLVAVVIIGLSFLQFKLTASTREIDTGEITVPNPGGLLKIPKSIIFAGKFIEEGTSSPLVRISFDMYTGDTLLESATTDSRGAWELEFEFSKINHQILHDIMDGNFRFVFKSSGGDTLGEFNWANKLPMPDWVRPGRGALFSEPTSMYAYNYRSSDASLFGQMLIATTGNDSARWNLGTVPVPAFGGIEVRVAFVVKNLTYLNAPSGRMWY